MQASCSPFSVQSNPSGLVVQVNGTVAGVTPITVTPQPTVLPATGQAGASQITIQSGSSAPNYTVTFNQLRNGPHTVFYNRALDTQGSINTNFQSVVRQSLSAGPPLNVARRPVVTDIRTRASIDPRHFYVKYRAAALAQGGRSARDIEAYEGLGEGTEMFTQDGIDTRALTIPAGSSYDEIAAKLLRHPEVAKVEHAHLRYTLGAPVTPNDPHFQLQNEQWDMFQIQMPQAWSYTEGAGVTIAVLDTGYDSTSADFPPSKVTTALTFLNGNATPTSGATDTDGHGSNTAGIAAAATNNNFGFAGTGFNASLMILKIIDPSGNISTVDEANALHYATDHGAKVISLSIGGAEVDSSGNNGYDDVEFAGIQYALQHNVVVVAAAGNESTPYIQGHQPACNTSLPACGLADLDYPAAYPGVISVGASAYCDKLVGQSCSGEYVASYSNGGPGLSLVAPGGDPASSNDSDNFHWITNLSSPINKQFPCSEGPPDAACVNQFAGTSQATPHVAGAAALALALNPSLTPAQIAQLLEETADNLPGIDPNYEGHGRLNVARALAKLTGDSSFPSYTPAPNQFIAFAYTNSGFTGAPQIIDLFYTSGVPVNSDGTFRIADINPSTPYKIGVWYNAAGNGVVSAGDYFGETATCGTSSPCSASNIVVGKLSSNVIP
ncbi:MAG: S8 family serine peptidase [Candidatus Eremiobacteraeota bacterium]|nr:S8 family serine peptidase [Candidatus Eremiobacteraeota bacterium]